MTNPDSKLIAAMLRDGYYNDGLGYTGDEIDAMAAELEALALEQRATVCWQHRPGAPCPVPASCRDNGCSAIERELFAAAQVPSGMIAAAQGEGPNPGLSKCNDSLREQRKPTPKVCAECGNGPCWFPLP